MKAITPLEKLVQEIKDEMDVLRVYLDRSISYRGGASARKCRGSMMKLRKLFPKYSKETRLLWKVIKKKPI